MGLNTRMEVYLEPETAKQVDDTDEPNSEFIRNAIRHALREKGKLDQ